MSNSRHPLLCFGDLLMFSCSDFCIRGAYKHACCIWPAVKKGELVTLTDPVAPGLQMLMWVQKIIWKSHTQTYCWILSISPDNSKYMDSQIGTENKSKGSCLYHINFSFGRNCKKSRFPRLDLDMGCLQLITKFYTTKTLEKIYLRKGFPCIQNNIPVYLDRTILILTQAIIILVHSMSLGRWNKVQF